MYRGLIYELIGEIEEVKTSAAAGALMSKLLYKTSPLRSVE